jgi:hypothetical protein
MYTLVALKTKCPHIVLGQRYAGIEVRPGQDSVRTTLTSRLAGLHRLRPLLDVEP